MALVGGKERVLDFLVGYSPKKAIVGIGGGIGMMSVSTGEPRIDIPAKCIGGALFLAGTLGSVISGLIDEARRPESRQSGEVTTEDNS